MQLLKTLKKYVDLERCAMRVALHGRASFLHEGEKVSAEDLQQAMSALHLRALDADGDGQVDVNEVHALLVENQKIFGTEGSQAEGDAAMYEPAQLMARYKLRTAPAVLREMERWWACVCFQIDEALPAGMFKPQQ